MIKRLTFVILISFTSCHYKNSYRNVGDIPFNDSIDSKDFNLCDEQNIRQYYVRQSADRASGYKGEKKALIKSVFESYSYPFSVSENGYITFRFIVNCDGEMGRFRVEEMDFEFQEHQFDTKIVNQLLDIIQDLEGWIPRRNDERKFDFYQYITFKIKNGQIIEILP